MAKAGCDHNVPRKRLYSIKELVRDIGAKTCFWRTQIWNGQLPCVKVGTKMFIDYVDIEAFIQKHKVSN